MTIQLGRWELNTTPNQSASYKHKSKDSQMYKRQSLPEFSATLTKRFPDEFTDTHTMIPSVMEHLFAMCGGLPHAVTESDIETANIACYVILYPEAAAPFMYDPDSGLLSLN